MSLPRCPVSYGFLGVFPENFTAYELCEIAPYGIPLSRQLEREPTREFIVFWICMTYKDHFSHDISLHIRGDRMQACSSGLYGRKTARPIRQERQHASYAPHRSEGSPKRHPDHGHLDPPAVLSNQIALSRRQTPCSLSVLSLCGRS